ncbi:hypothetical protein PSTG_13178 [Puccinia striiformis f. sp. tritici PST-78]|uniref:HAT C-terminal dimerisation domain-containing protein n=1 Tax=Puccinia striiformis f. sp. tritici PST-78 TaxID=1165861 RepID=A0A0L0V2E5_9BASI|nr:hypothetical protein PSTG_13178 [Puccinia striiformis f. sp. tritici PST-78]
MVKLTFSNSRKRKIFSSLNPEPQTSKRPACHSGDDVSQNSIDQRSNSDLALPSKLMISQPLCIAIYTSHKKRIVSLHLTFVHFTLNERHLSIPVSTSDHHASCKQTLAKFCAIAKKLRYSPNSKAKFVDICQEKGRATPHTVERDVRTRWNSTGAQLKSILRCEAAILVWQHNKKHGVKRKYYVDKSDFELARNLVDVLNLFFKITLQISVAGLARLANIVLFINQITKHLSTAITNEKYPPALRNACRLRLKKTNKYYSLTDSSPLYRITILLHPSLSEEYFKLANWEPNWIAKAIRLARNMWWWVSQLNEIQPSLAQPKTTMLASLGSAAAARDGHSLSDPFNMWLRGGLVLNNGNPVNPLKWWMKQKRTGNTHGGLVHMALDVLSCPATSVDVERAFSFGRDYVTSKRHRLAPKSVSRGMTVAFYSKNQKIPEGILSRWKHGLKEDHKMQRKGKEMKGVVTAPRTASTRSTGTGLVAGAGFGLKNQPVPGCQRVPGSHGAIFTKL